MPFIPLIALGAGLVGGFYLASGAERTTELAKWLAIGGAVYVGAKLAKVI
jgi:hypothetical protein